MIWLVGGAGMLGQEVKALLERRAMAHVSTDVEIDITDEAAVRRATDRHRPRWILNCAAYTAVDRAESDEARAHAVNALGPLHLARAAGAVGARLVHVSTDYVFGASDDGPYQEDAEPAPLGAYGRTKAAGEALVRETTPEHLIVRTAWLHGPQGPNFVATMLRLMTERPRLRVVDDQRGSPTYAADLAEVLVTMVTSNLTAFGTYHYTNEGSCTWYEFALEIQAQALACGLVQQEVPIEPIPSSSYPTAARRPTNSILGRDRVRAALGLRIPSWQDGLARHLARRRIGST